MNITTLIEQLGGSRLIAMTGAKHFVYSDSSAFFDFKGSRKANRCHITLDPSDTYTVEFFRINRARVTVVQVARYNDVYADNLQSIFEKATGLFLSL